MPFNPHMVTRSSAERLNSYGLHWLRHRLYDCLQNYISGNAFLAPYGTLEPNACFIELADILAHDKH